MKTETVVPTTNQEGNDVPETSKKTEERVIDPIEFDRVLKKANDQEGRANKAEIQLDKINKAKLAESQEKERLELESKGEYDKILAEKDLTMKGQSARLKELEVKLNGYVEKESLEVKTKEDNLLSAIKDEKTKSQILLIAEGTTGSERLNKLEATIGLLGGVTNTYVPNIPEGKKNLGELEELKSFLSDSKNKGTNEYRQKSKQYSDLLKNN